MISGKDIKKEIDQVGSLMGLTEAYGEIASVRMMKIRGFVLKNREFLSAINSIFRDSLDAYGEKLSELVKEGKLKKGSKVTFLAHNGKTVAALISANTGFYGGVVQATFRKFIKDIKDRDVEITIIGRLGRSYLLSEAPGTPYTYFELPDYGTDVAKLAEVIKHLVAYDEIQVYYGKYRSVVSQEPSMFTISAGTRVDEKVQVPQVHYLFEPSIEDILMFFETEIFASLFDQSIRESQLAKLASRILAMDRAGEKIREELKKLNLEKLKYRHRQFSRKQLNSLSSVMYLGS
jgi:ATP synthase F1 gamma subunit